MFVWVCMYIFSQPFHKNLCKYLKIKKKDLIVSCNTFKLQNDKCNCGPLTCLFLCLLSTETMLYAPLDLKLLRLQIKWMLYNARFVPDCFMLN